LQKFNDPELGPGIVLGGNVRVKDSLFRGNAIGLIVGQGSDLIGNIVNFNIGAGMMIDGGSTLVNNTVSNNGGIGISVGCPSTLWANTATGNAGGDLSTPTVGAGCVNGQGIP
jgi:hypothetical protein